jgi:hypothetical protein
MLPGAGPTVNSFPHAHLRHCRSRGVEVDVLCTGRFYDVLEKLDGRSGIVRRQSTYEKIGSIRS